MPVKDENKKQGKGEIDISRRQAIGKLAYATPVLMTLGQVREVHAQLPGSPPCPPTCP